MGQNESSGKGLRSKASNQSNKVNFSVSNSQSGTARDKNVFNISPQVTSSVDVGVSEMFACDRERSLDHNPSNLPLPPIEKSCIFSNHTEPRPLAVTASAEDNHIGVSASIGVKSSANAVKIVELPDNVVPISMKVPKSEAEDSVTCVDRDIRTVPKNNGNSGSSFLSAKLTADLRQYENKTETKNSNKESKNSNKNYKNSNKDSKKSNKEPKNSNNDSKNSNKDSMAGPFQNLVLICKLEEDPKSDKVKNKLEEIYASKDLSPNDLDKCALEALYNLSEDDALYILHTFSECNLKTIKNKSAYLCSIIKTKTNEPNLRKLGNKTPPPYVDPTPLVPFTETKSPAQKIVDKKLENINNPEKYYKDKNSALPMSLFDNNSPPLGKNSPNRNSPTLDSGLVNKDSQFNFIPCNPVDYSKPFERTRNPLPAANFGDKQKTNLSKMVGNRRMKPSHSSKSLINKHAELEKIANNMTTCVSDVRKPPPTTEKHFFLLQPDLNLLNSNKVNTATNLKLEECIFELEKLDNNTKGLITHLQPAILYNLQKINSFLDLLKSNLNMNENVYCELNKLKDRISLLTDVNEIIQRDESFGLPNNLELIKWLDPKSKENEFHGINHKLDSININGEKEVADTVLANKNETRQQNILLNTFISMLEDLSPELQDQKENIALLDDMLFCKVCNKPITVNLSNLEEHLLGRNHNQILNGMSEKPAEMGKSHLDILDVVHQSRKNKLWVPSLYICIPCDFLASNEDDANRHVESVNHREQNQMGDITWRLCNVCPMNIYGTSNDFEQHSLTTQHLEIAKLKNVMDTQELSDAGSVSDGGDQKSICSSKSDINGSQLRDGMKTPHDILLSIAQQRKSKSNGSKVGLYCEVCRRYFLNPINLAHFESSTHSTMLSKVKGRKNFVKHYCSSCNVDIYGTPNVITEHGNNEIHKDLADIKNQSTQQQNKTGPCELSDKNSPHFKIMTKVFKRHILNESKAGAFFGFYCHPCQAYSEEERQWAFHQSTASHISRLNLPEYVGKNLCHDCLVCNVRLIADDTVFNMHTNTKAHVLIERKQSTSADENADVDRESSNEEVSHESDEDLVDGEEDSQDYDDEFSEDSDEDERASEVSNQNSTKQDQTVKRAVPIMPNGVYVTGLPPKISHKELFEHFKSFGFIKRSALVSHKNSARVIFKTEEDAAKLIKLKTLTLGGSKITIRPLIDYSQMKCRNEARFELHPKVTSVLALRTELDSCVIQLQKEVTAQGLFFTQKSNQIRQDINAIFKECKVHFFGSQVTGLALNNSDFDIYIDFDNRSYFKELPQKNQEYYIKMLLAEFSKPNSNFEIKASVLTARVPIVRTLHRGTNTLCDISCCSGLSVENSQLVKTFLSHDARARWLVLFIKWWMQTNELLDRTVFTSYACTWLVFFFLMQLPKPVFCSVADLRQCCPNKYFIANWDCRFYRHIHKIFKSANKQSNLNLVASFFKYYGTFNFKTTVLSPLTATLIPRQQFINLQLPYEYFCYVDKVSRYPDAEKLRIGTPICLQDPFDLSHNITKGVSRVDLQRFQELCKKSVILCERLVEA